MASKITYNDGSDYTYRFPERSCKTCIKYPCIKDMQNYKSDFAKCGCINYADINTF